MPQNSAGYAWFSFRKALQCGSARFHGNRLRAALNSGSMTNANVEIVGVRIENRCHILLHYFLVVDCVPHINVGLEGQLVHRRVKVDYVSRVPLRVQVSV
jgi:hypothetical protein